VVNSFRNGKLGMVIRLGVNLILIWKVLKKQQHRILLNSLKKIQYHLKSKPIWSIVKSVVNSFRFLLHQIYLKKVSILNIVVDLVLIVEIGHIRIS
jgi:hypothetical protein